MKPFLVYRFDADKAELQDQLYELRNLESKNEAENPDDVKAIAKNVKQLEKRRTSMWAASGPGNRRSDLI